MDKVKDTVNSLIGKLEDPTEKKKIAPIKTKDTITGLKNTLSGLLVERIKKLQDEEDFEAVVKVALLKKIKTGEVKVSDLMSLLNQTKIRTTEAFDSIFQFFKPSSSERVPFLDEETDLNITPEEHVFNNSSSETLQAINELTNAVQQIVKDKKSEE